MRSLPLALLLLPLSARAQTEPCRSEHSSRWSIKTMADAEAATLAHAQPQEATIGQLRALPRPSKTHSPTRWGEEKMLRRVRGVILGYQLEEDEDIHLVLADARDRSRAVIIEVPQPACADRSPFADEFAKVRASIYAKLGKPEKMLVYHRLKQPAAVVVTGPVFFDVIHGKQEGESPNGAEIHPVLMLTFEDGAAAASR